ncbi:uncharacterized protein LOC143447436 isoform X2 [Clavelina lepadiformis]|uniref:BZIP domain-containing protein n=1 Tax=Clavelina lepadiformis TaxID=159417 RepID=A0ABP0GVK5_CLALP
MNNPAFQLNIWAHEASNVDKGSTCFKPGKSFPVLRSHRVDGMTVMPTDDLQLVEEHIRPLIKEELRYTIQSKRMARGLPGTVEIEYKAPRPDDVSPHTIEKRERRRERNKVAAAKCRFKKKIVSENLQEESEHLENINLQLKREIQRLQEERQKLIYVFNLHKPTCVIPCKDNDTFMASISGPDTMPNNDKNLPKVPPVSQSYDFAETMSHETRAIDCQTSEWNSPISNSATEYVNLPPSISSQGITTLG